MGVGGFNKTQSYLNTEQPSRCSTSHGGKSLNNYSQREVMKDLKQRNEINPDFKAMDGLFSNVVEDKHYKKIDKM